MAAAPRGVAAASPGGGPGGARLAARPLRIAHGPSPPGGHVAALAGSQEEGRGAQRWPWPWADRRWVRDGVLGCEGGRAGSPRGPLSPPAPLPRARRPTFWGRGSLGLRGPGLLPAGLRSGAPREKGKGGEGARGPPRMGAAGTRVARILRRGWEGRGGSLFYIPAERDKGFPLCREGEKKIEDPLHTHAEASRCCCGWGKVCVLHPAAETWRELRGELRLGGRGRETERSGSPLTFPALGSKAEVVPEPGTRLWLLAEQMVCLQGGTGTRRVLVGLMMCLWGCPATGLL